MKQIDHSWQNEIMEGQEGCNINLDFQEITHFGRVLFGSMVYLKGSNK